MPEETTNFNGWAKVEILGRQMHIGFVTTQVFGTAVMFRIDQPAIPSAEEILQRPEWVGDTYAAPGSIIKREDIEAATVLVGAGSIYRIIPCDEAAALKAIRASQQRPLMIVKLVKAKQLASATGSVFYDEDDNKDDDIPL